MHYPCYSDLRYDVNGHLIGAVDNTGQRRFTYVADAQGLILNRSEIAGNSVNRVQRYYYVDGKRVGDVGNDGPSRMDYVSAMANRGTDQKAYKNWKPIASADFDQNYEPISPSYPGTTASTYTVKNGDTPQSIALQVWGDAQMWYLIADANGLNSNESLTVGQSLTIPNKVTNLHNNSETYRVYNPGEAIGDVNPTLPTAPPIPQPSKKKGCGGMGAILVAVVTVAVAVVTQQYQLLPAIITNLGPAAIAAGAAAVGNIAGQVTGNLLGVQNGFNVGSLATSVLTAGATEGLLGGTVNYGNGVTSPLTSFGRSLSQAVGGGWSAVAARAVVNNVVGQGVGNLTGTQKGFSWSSMAAAGVGAAAGAYVGDRIGTALMGKASYLDGNNLSKTAGVITSTAQGITASLVSQATQIALDGRGKLNWANVAINGVSAGVGYLAGYNDPKNGGMPNALSNGNLSNAEAQIANGQRYAEVTKGKSTDTLDEVQVRATRLPLLDEVTQTADRLMQLNYLNQNSTRAEVRAMTPMEDFATFSPVGVRLQGLANIGNNIVGGTVGMVRESWAINNDAIAYATGGQRSVITGKFEPESRILQSLNNGTAFKDGAGLFGEAVTSTVRGPFDLIDGIRYGNADKIGSGGAVVLGAAGLALGRLGRSEVAIKNLNLTYPVQTEANQAFFWSGKTNGIGGESVARQIAQKNQGTTLETLIENRRIQMPTWDSTNPEVVKAWKAISADYAFGSSGTVRAVIGQTLRQGNVWETAELPSLIKNPNVNKIITIDPVTRAETEIFVRSKK